MPDQDLIRGALAKALKAIGPDKLSERLRAPSELIQTWINGFATMPERKVTVLMAILAEIDAE